MLLLLTNHSPDNLSTGKEPHLNSFHNPILHIYLSALFFQFSLGTYTFSAIERKTKQETLHLSVKFKKITASSIWGHVRSVQ